MSLEPTQSAGIEVYRCAADLEHQQPRRDGVASTPDTSASTSEGDDCDRALRLGGLVARCEGYAATVIAYNS
jgi:hypothetical protein